MKYYKTTTEYNCGIDLHARQMYICIMDREEKGSVRYFNILEKADVGDRYEHSTLTTNSPPRGAAGSGGSEPSPKAKR